MRNSTQGLAIEKQKTDHKPFWKRGLLNGVFFFCVNDEC